MKHSPDSAVPPDFAVVNIHYKNTQNIGDLVSAPSLYFPLSGERRHLKSPAVSCAALIVGGGGLLNPALSKMVQRHLSSVDGPVIAWGIGTNTHHAADARTPDWLKTCDLVGLRDDQTEYPWVPCASCMSPEFDRQVPPVCPA